MNADLLLKEFHRLSEAPDAVARLRTFILDLAVRGKLEKQDPSDEPAKHFLARIDFSKSVLARKNGRISGTTSNTRDELPFSIPKSWAVAELGAIALKLGAGSTPLGGKTVYTHDGVPFIRSQNVYDDGLKLDGVALIPRKIHELMSGTHVELNDLLLNITGASIGRCALVPLDFVEGNVSQHVAIIRLIEPALRDFIHLALIAPFYQKLIMSVQVGVSREGLSMQRLKNFSMIIPPLAEQHRIVARVDELMRLCDELESAQATREALRRKLLEATLHQALTLKNGAGV